MAFNPDNFQFERILPPELNKPILEWDALHRFIVVRVLEGDEFSFYSTLLSNQVNQNIHDGMPDEWSHENDRIVSFSIYEDGDYLLEKEKIKFDFSTKKTKRVRYKYTELEETQAIEIFNVLKAAIQVATIQEKIDRSKAVIDLASRQSFLTQLDSERQDQINTLMTSSDWTQLADATESFTGEIALWTSYRAYLRDNNQTVDTFDDPLDFLLYEEEFKWPIDPIEYHRIDPSHDVEYLSVPEHFVGSPHSAGVRSSEQLNGALNEAAITEKLIARNGGIPISTEIWNKVQQYNLNRDIANVDLDHLNVGG